MSFYLCQKNTNKDKMTVTFTTLALKYMVDLIFRPSLLSIRFISCLGLLKRIDQK